MKRARRYVKATEIISDDKEYEPEEAISLIKKTATAKFDETIELHLRTGSDPRQADQLIRGVTMLPHGVGKTVRVAVFAEGETVGVAEKAGADFVGSNELIKKIEGGWTDFDVSIATPDMMSRVGRLGKILGRRGLMPNPRNGTVVQAEDIEKAISDAKKGRVEFKLDRDALVHVAIGRASFAETNLMDNMTAIMDDIVRARPGGVKGQYIRSAYLTSTMGPSVTLNVASTMAMKVE